MRYFWQGFKDRKCAPVNFKRHLIVLFFSPDCRDGSEAYDQFSSTYARYPSVKIKVINVKKDSSVPIKHDVGRFPTVLLLKNGREVDRLEKMAGSKTVLEELFIRANI